MLVDFIAENGGRAHEEAVRTKLGAHLGESVQRIILIY
jgi:hypothetical protein